MLVAAPPVLTRAKMPGFFLVTTTWCHAYIGTNIQLQRQLAGGALIFAGEFHSAPRAF